MISNIAKMIDHTLLKADATKQQIKTLCDEAKEHQFASVCVNPVWVRYAADLLKGTDVKVCTVVGFPLGASTPETKAFETKDAIENGADEIDMVINIGALKSGEPDLVEHDIKAVKAVAADNAVLKVIIETSLLTDEEKTLVCQIAKRAGAEFVKTSTGFSSGGATATDIALMRKAVGEVMGIKASGGVRTIGDVEKMTEAGATRIGSSSGVDIVKKI